jgi:hypothetical protein
MNIETITTTDAANRRWTIRRTCIDTPGRAYAARLVDDIDDTADILPGVVGFYAETIDDIRHKLNGGA